MRVATVQYRSSRQPDQTISVAHQLGQHIHHEQPDVILFPEHSFFLGRAPEDFLPYAKPISSHPWVTVLQSWSREWNTTVIAGSIPEWDESLQTLFHTCCVLFPDERPPLYLRKQIAFRGYIHQTFVEEIPHVIPGPLFLTFSHNTWEIGVMFGAGLYYSHLFCALRYTQKCDVVLLPASFYTSSTSEHWLTLLRARAIEFQMYIASANQSALPAEEKSLFSGQSSIIHPCGKMLSLASCDGEALCLQDLSKECIIQSRIAADIAYNDTHNSKCIPSS